MFITSDFTVSFADTETNTPCMQQSTVASMMRAKHLILNFLNCYWGWKELSTAIKNLEKMLSQNLIIDPSIISGRYGFCVLWFFRDKYKSSNIILPTCLYKALEEKNHSQILWILKKWQWRLRYAEAEEWIKSPDFAEEVSKLLEISSPASEFWKLEMDPSLVEEIAIEIREVAVRLKAPLIATSRSFKRWLTKKAVTILEVTSKEYKKFKRNMRKEYKESLKTRLLVRGVQLELTGTTLVVILIALKSGTLPSDLGSLLPSLGSGAAGLLYEAIVVDP